MTNIQQKIINEIENHETIIIHRHVNPDPDALGSQGGLKELILHSFKNKNVFVVGEEVEGLKFIETMDTLTDKDYTNALVLVLDTATIDRISLKDAALSGARLIKIDHHPDLDPFGDISWVDTSFSSTSEMIVDLVKHSDNKLSINDEAARKLYAGFIGDTGRFLYPSTSARTLSHASLLLEYAFDPQDIFNALYEIDQKTARLKGDILSNYKTTEQGVAYYCVTNEVLDTFDVAPVDAANLVNVLKDIKGNKVWVFFVEYPEEIRVRIRSASTPINTVAKEYNGGGHPLASGATVESWAEATELIESLNRLLDQQ